MIRCHWNITLLLLALLPASTEAAMRALIYQPQLRDRDVAPAQWQQIFESASNDGFDTLVLQWTAHGAAFNDEAGRNWLRARMQQAHAAGLELIVGLHADPAFFQAQQQRGTALSNYLHRLARRNHALARYWQSQSSFPLAGWYLPMEIDDLRWRETTSRKALLSYLRTEAAELGKSGLPVFVTSFAAGHSAPATYARLLTDASATGVQVWWQDGAGTGKLSAAERSLYQSALHGDCQAPAVAGIVREVFVQTGSDDAFTAQPLPEPEMETALAQEPVCDGDIVFFELRYLPHAEEAAPVLRDDETTASRTR